MTFDFNILYLLISAAVAAGVAWGVAAGKIKVIGEEVAAMRTKVSIDHDLLVEIRTKLDMLLGTNINVIKKQRNEKL